MTNILLDYVEAIGQNKSFWNKRNNNRNIGSSNIRNLATLANNADCYKEFRLFIQYKIAKGNGWDQNFKDNKRFGDVIIDYMDEIYEKCGRDDKKALENIGKFFGYLFWKKRSIEKG